MISMVFLLPIYCLRFCLSASMFPCSSLCLYGGICIPRQFTASQTSLLTVAPPHVGYYSCWEVLSGVCRAAKLLCATKQSTARTEQQYCPELKRGWGKLSSCLQVDLEIVVTTTVPTIIIGIVRIGRTSTSHTLKPEVYWKSRFCHYRKRCAPLPPDLISLKNKDVEETPNFPHLATKISRHCKTPLRTCSGRRPGDLRNTFRETVRRDVVGLITTPVPVSDSQTAHIGSGLNITITAKVAFGSKTRRSPHATSSFPSLLLRQVPQASPANPEETNTGRVASCAGPSLTEMSRTFRMPHHNVPICRRSRRLPGGKHQKKLLLRNLVPTRIKGVSTMGLCA